ncbi:TSUP family transporter [Peribacillus butanolivorans]|uniref:TSUP family transporter n=1 Tax=Peribacillus TaxID=2675229 RepID=UPI001914124F|nr:MULTISPECIES: TSUP family transporter [unclassified Peribacillus]MBK5461644.1 TSUP family transporter [Peribacillus sp. TH27]MBK5485036.1 TSUP family transporter [Peribacillus sp. TH16]WMX55128.1 TSUP family transporter [Peribacillus sp. R9-11]
MEEINLYTLLFLILAGFIAAFIDSVVGGGGLISIPALLFTGISPSAALATNKLASSMGSLTSTISFIRAGKVNFKFVMKLFPLTVIGAILGAYVVHFVSPEILKPLILILLVIVAIYTILKKDWGKDAKYKGLKRKKMIMLIIAIFAIGFYDGFLGPGTGSFLLFSFLIIGFDFVQAAGNAKVLNFGSNIAALIIFLSMGSVNFVYGIPMGLAMVVGALVGSNFAIKKGAAYVRILFICVTILLIGKNVLNYLHVI